MQRLVVLMCTFATTTAAWAESSSHVLWEGDNVRAGIVPPVLAAPLDTLVVRTIDDYLQTSCGKTIPTFKEGGSTQLSIVVGDETNNPLLRLLVDKGLKLNRDELGDEGYRILTHTSDGSDLVIITANTPAGLKYGCQELMFFHTSLTEKSAAIDWPLNIVKKPAMAYRGTYILPCWSAYDSIESWTRVLQFHSELTLNRNWFWVGGFPLLAKYGGEYAGTDLAKVENVRGLVDLCRAQAMKFYIGDGWFTWHHAKAAKGSLERGTQYYLDLMDLLPGAAGIYLEPVGEGSGAEEKVWRPQAEAIKKLAEAVWKKRPDYEFAIAIGKFNPPEYRRIIHSIDDKRLFWWWCWGNPIQMNAKAEHPLVLGWHVITRMSDFHGCMTGPKPTERSLTGYATSYDPGQGFGNPWNGWAKLGYDKPRNVHPHTMPLFSHQYLFRERCWDVDISDGQFWAKMARRLFDADMPAESIQRYRALVGMCFGPKSADAQELADIDAFVTAHADKGTARNRDTLMRMREAVIGVQGVKKAAATQPTK